jgi:hypothetical protein
MKRNVLILSAMLALLLVALSGMGSGRIRAGHRGDQNNATQSEPSKQTNEEKKVAYDIYGKRLRVDEKYIADRTLPNGRIIAYRKNKREIASLVRALKEDGVTNEKLLDTKTWSTISCFKNVNNFCANVSCTFICRLERHRTARANEILGYCECGN